MCVRQICFECSANEWKENRKANKNTVNGYDGQKKKEKKLKYGNGVKHALCGIGLCPIAREKCYSLFVYTTYNLSKSVDLYDSIYKTFAFWSPPLFGQPKWNSLEWDGNIENVYHVDDVHNNLQRSTVSSCFSMYVIGWKFHQITSSLCARCCGWTEYENPKCEGKKLKEKLQTPIVFFSFNRGSRWNEEKKWINSNFCYYFLFIFLLDGNV